MDKWTIASRADLEDEAEVEELFDKATWKILCETSFFKMSKPEARKILLGIRDSIPKEKIKACSEAVIDKVRSDEWYFKANVVMAYLSFGSELSVDGLIEAMLADGKTVVVPYIVSKTEMKPVVLKDLKDVEIGKYGIRTAKEPHEFMDYSEVDLILVPGIAFDAGGCRLGMGAGYYDRVLAANRNCAMIGISYRDLVLGFEELPFEEHDVKISLIATECNTMCVS